MTGDISQEDYDKLQQKTNDKLAHLHLFSWKRTRKLLFYIVKNIMF